MTDRLLLDECLRRKRLPYKYIIIDEAHERSLDSDILIGILKDRLKKGKGNFRLVIASATIDPDLFVNYFKDLCIPPVIRVSGRTFPVAINWGDDLRGLYKKENKNKQKIYASTIKRAFSKLQNAEIGNNKTIPIEKEYTNASVNKVLEILGDEDGDNNSDENGEIENNSKGDILVFLTCQEEIKKCVRELETKLQYKENIAIKESTLVLSLYGQLDPEEQKKVFEPTPKKRKVIFSTNIAETSVTIDGVKHIVDTGMAKESRFDPILNMSVLELTFISQSSAQQRAGRAGRTSSGTCHRLYSLAQFENMKPSQIPEILRTHLGLCVLRLKGMGIDPQSFDFIQKPSAEAITASIKTLFYLGALDEKEKITDIGKKMLFLPTEPSVSKALLVADEMGCFRDVLIVVGMLPFSRNLFSQSQNQNNQEVDFSRYSFAHKDGDHLSFLALYKAWRKLPYKQRPQWSKDNHVSKKTLTLAENQIKQIENAFRFMKKNPTKQLNGKDGKDDKDDKDEEEEKENENEITEINAQEEGEEEDENNTPEEIRSQNIRKALAAGFFSNFCLTQGTDDKTYLVASQNIVSYVHPSSVFSLGVNQQPKFLLFNELFQTSKPFIWTLMKVELDWLPQEFIKDKKIRELAEEIIEPFAPKSFSNISTTLLKALFGNTFSKMTNFQSQFGNVIIKAQNNQLTIRCSKKQLEVITQKLDIFLNEQRNLLKKECLEISHGRTGARLLIGVGGVIRKYLRANDLPRISITNIPFSATINQRKSFDENVIESWIREKFSQFGEIIEISGNFDETRTFGWGQVLFEDPKSAVDACDKLNNHVVEDNMRLKVQQIRSQTSNISSSTSYLESCKLRLSWPIAKSEGFGAIIFSSLEQVNQFIAVVTRNKPSFDGKSPTFVKDKVKNNKVLIRNLAIETDEVDIHDYLKRNGFQIPYKDVWLKRTPVKKDDSDNNNHNNDDDEEQLQQVLLISRIGSYGEIVDMNLGFLNEKKGNGFWRKGEVVFEKPENALNAARSLNGQVGIFGDQKLRAKSGISMKISFHLKLFEKLEDKIQTVLNMIRQKSDAFEIQIIKPDSKSKNSNVIIKVVSNSAEDNFYVHFFFLSFLFFILILIIYFFNRLNVKLKKVQCVMGSHCVIQKLIYQQLCTTEKE